MNGHPHAQLAQQYWKEAETNERAWENWEHFVSHRAEWRQCIEDPSWQINKQYRRRPRTININGFEVPEPVREPLEDGQPCFLASQPLGRPAFQGWKNTDSQYQWLKHGLIHLTEEAAQLHIDALLSFTKR